MRNNWSAPPGKAPLTLPQLLVSLQSTFPPLTINATNGSRRAQLLIPAHAYYGRFVPTSDLHTTKAVRNKLRRVRFFLHPDKLPPTFGGEQRVLARVLWDIVSEAEDAYSRALEELDWAM
ncbi:hypothetical protein TeGR_g12337 [Tetraparma gracilis]|nr:hypothetical protein TeGR_g12337 [Tetraparma gracilis]